MGTAVGRSSPGAGRTQTANIFLCPMPKAKLSPEARPKAGSGRQGIRLAPLRSLNSLRRYVGSGEDWRQGVWNRWLVSYLTPKSEAVAGEGGIRTDGDAHPATPAESKRTESSPGEASSGEPTAQELSADEPRPEGPRGRERRAEEPTAGDASVVEQRQLAARARLEALSQQMYSVEEGLDALCQRLHVGELTDRRATQRMMELIERVVETAERQSEALERSLVTLERVERRLARLDRWVRPAGAESVPPPPLGTSPLMSSIVGLEGALRHTAHEEPPSRRVPSMSGSLSEMSVATLLSMFELEKRSGSLSIEGERHEVRFDLLDGAVVCGQVDDRSEDPLDVLRTAIAWRTGRFSFCPGPVATSDYPPRSVGALLLEASHQNDEAVRVVG